MTALELQGTAAKAAAMKLMVCGTSAKNKALSAIAQALVGHKEEILKANAVDMAKAKENNMRPALMDRLLLDEKRIEHRSSVLEWRASDPSALRQMSTRRTGLSSGAEGPLGVIAIIYESRPNVTVTGGALSEGRQRRHSPRRQGGI
jgi:glutamate-5-semialdehyde dehydrogenase